jgi:hypothetical protein
MGNDDRRADDAKRYAEGQRVDDGGQRKKRSLGSL